MHAKLRFSLPEKKQSGRGGGKEKTKIANYFLNPIFTHNKNAAEKK